MTTLDEWCERALKAEAKAEVLGDQLDKANRAILDLKREGYALPPPVGEPPEAVEILPDEVMDTIADLADPNTPVHRRLVRYAARRLRGDQEDTVDAETVCQEIRKGGDLEGF